MANCEEGDKSRVKIMIKASAKKQASSVLAGATANEPETEVVDPAPGDVPEPVRGG